VAQELHALRLSNLCAPALERRKGSPARWAFRLPARGPGSCRSPAAARGVAFATCLRGSWHWIWSAQLQS